MSQYQKFSIPNQYQQSYMIPDTSLICLSESENSHWRQRHYTPSSTCSFSCACTVFPFLLVLAVPFILPPNCHLITYTAYRTYRRIFICTQGDRPGSPGPNKMTRVSRTLAVVQSRVPGFVHADSEQQPLMLKIPSLSHLMSLWQMWTRRSLCGRNQKMDRCVYPPQRKCTHFVRRHSIWRVAEWNVASFAHKLQAHINFSFF